MKDEDSIIIDINRIPREELGKDCPIELRVCDTEVDMYWRVAIDVLETIVENNKKGEPISLYRIETCWR